MDERGRELTLKCYCLIFKMSRLSEFLSLKTIKCSWTPKNLGDKCVAILAFQRREIVASVGNLSVQDLGLSK